MFKSDQSVLSQYDAYRIPGSPLHEFVQEKARELGIKQPVEVFVSRSKATNAALVPQAKNLRIIVTEPLLEAMESPLHAPVSEELKAIMGHELGHLKEGMGMHGLGRYLYGGYLPIVALAEIAVVARHYVARAHEKQLSREQATHFIYHEADAEDPPKADSQSLYPHESKWQTIAKDVAVGSLGLIGGGFIAKVNSHQLEYACDRWGAKVTSPETMRNALLKLEKFKTETMLKGIKIPESDPFRYGEVQSKIGKWFIDVVKNTLTPHPNLWKRINTMDKMIVR